MPKPKLFTQYAENSFGCMDDTFTELDKKVAQLYKQALYSWMDFKDRTLPSSWCPLYSAKHLSLGRSKKSGGNNRGKEKDSVIEAFSAHFNETKQTPFGGTLQADCCIDPGCLVYYYEVKINKLKTGAVISIGFGEEWSENYKEKGRSSKLPGQLWNTFGWLSNGDLLCSGEKVGGIQGYEIGDIVGIGLNYVDGNIFCTKKVNKNDYFVVAYSQWRVQEFRVVPKVGFHKSAEIRANFGQDHFEYHETLRDLIEKMKDKPAAAELIAIAQTNEIPNTAAEVDLSRLARLKKLFPYVTEGEPLPSRWSHRHSRYNIQLSSCGLEVTCKRICPTVDCAGSVRSDVPIPVGLPFYYFEVKVLEPDGPNSIAIGICTEQGHLGHRPGRFFYSYGYHSDGSANGPELREGIDKEQKIYRYKDWQPTFKKGDVIGCGLNLADKDEERERSELFFTVNGRYLGFAYYYLAKEHWYPMVGMKLPGDRIKANFGQKNFAFDVPKYISENVRTNVPSITTTCLQYSPVKKSAAVSSKKQKAGSLKNRTPPTDKIRKEVSIRPAVLSPSQDISSDSCARIRPYVGKQSSNYLYISKSSTPEASGKESDTSTIVQRQPLPPCTPKSPKSSSFITHQLRDPRLSSLNPVPTTPKQTEYVRDACTTRQPSYTSQLLTNSTTPSSPLLSDPRPYSPNATRTKESCFPLKSCLKKNVVQNPTPFAIRSANPSKNEKLPTTTPTTHAATKKADCKNTKIASHVVERRSLTIEHFAGWLPKNKSSRNASDPMVSTTLCSSASSSYQNSPVERPSCSQVKSPTPLCGNQQNGDCSELVVELVERKQVAAAIDKLNSMMPTLLAKHQLLAYKLQLQKFLEMFRNFRDSQQNRDTKRMRLDNAESLQTSSSSQIPDFYDSNRSVSDEDLEREAAHLKDLAHKMEISAEKCSLFQETKEQIDAALLLMCTHEDEKKLLKTERCVALAADLRSAIKSFK